MELLSRKFILTVLVILLSYGLVITGKLEAMQWFTMAVVAAGIYSGANVVQKFTEKK